MSLVLLLIFYYYHTGPVESTGSTDLQLLRDNVPHVPHLSKELLHQTVSPAIVQRPGFGRMADICCVKHQR